MGGCVPKRPAESIRSSGAEIIHTMSPQNVLSVKHFAYIKMNNTRPATYFHVLWAKKP